MLVSAFHASPQRSIKTVLHEMCAPLWSRQMQSSPSWHWSCRCFIDHCSQDRGFRRCNKMIPEPPFDPPDVKLLNRSCLCRPIGAFCAHLQAEAGSQLGKKLALSVGWREGLWCTAGNVSTECILTWGHVRTG